MIQFKVFLGESFSVTATGRDKWDRMLANPGINAEVKMMTPDAAMKAMAKGQGTTAPKAVARRMKQGGQGKIDNLVRVMKKGTKMDMPVIEYARGGFSQDGFHRSMAAKEMGIKKIPVLVIHR